MSATVDAPGELKDCIWCGHKVPEPGKICPNCDSPQGSLCVVCKKALPEHASRCNTCQTYQKYWWQRIPLSTTILALLTALISVVSTGLIPLVSYFRNYHSHTSLTVANVDPKANAVYLHVWNNGHQRSRLVSYVMDFGDLPIETAELEPVDADRPKTVIGPDSEVNIELRVPELVPKQTNSSVGPKKPTLWITVEESNDTQRPLKVELSEDVLRGFVNNG